MQSGLFFRKKVGCPKQTFFSIRSDLDKISPDQCAYILFSESGRAHQKRIELK